MLDYIILSITGAIKMGSEMSDRMMHKETQQYSRCNRE